MTVDYEQIIRRQHPDQQKETIDGAELWESKIPDVTGKLIPGARIVVATSPDLQPYVFDIIVVEDGIVFLEQQGNRFPVPVVSIELGEFRGLGDEMHNVLEIQPPFPNNDT